MKTILCCIALACPAFAQFANGYANRRAITIDHTLIGCSTVTGLTNVPWTIQGTYPFLKTAAGGGEVRSNKGYDIIFTSDSAGSSMLSWSMDTYDGTTGAAVFHVQIPALSCTVDTVFYLFDGNASITTFQSPAKPWDANFKGVWHMWKFGDDTSNGHNLTAIGNAGGVASAAGQLGTAQDFSAGADTAHYNALDGGASSDFNCNAGCTIEAWIYLTGAQPTNTMAIGQLDVSSNPNQGWAIKLTNNGQLTVQVDNNSSVATWGNWGSNQ